MIRKPFKPPGSKDGAESTGSGLAKPFVKPGLKSTLTTATKPVVESKPLAKKPEV